MRPLHSRKILFVCRAALVRLLRKNSQQLSSKNRQFVSHSLKFEKNAVQQVRAWGLPDLLDHQWRSVITPRIPYSSGIVCALPHLKLRSGLSDRH